MYAVIEQGGKQYKVAQGDVIQIELTDVKPEAEKLEMDKVLFIGDGEKSKIGKPFIEGAKVTGKFSTNASDAVIGGPKIYTQHFRRRKNSKKRTGHRQKYLQLTIEKIEA
jgi:large subunit ribosomal protein L21